MNKLHNALDNFERTEEQTESNETLCLVRKQNISFVPMILLKFQLFTSRRLRPTDGTSQCFYIGALDRQHLIRLAVARIEINFHKAPFIGPPHFNNDHYFKQVNELRPYATVIRVTAKYALTILSQLIWNVSS